MVINIAEDDAVFRENCLNFQTEEYNVESQKLVDIRPQIGNKIGRIASRCVQSDREIRDAVKQCTRNTSRVPCRIDVCKTPIRITRPASPSRRLGTTTESGIDLSNKDIIIDCVLPCPTGQCRLEGNGDSRLFYGSNSNVTFRSFVFANGYDPKSGGAFKMENKSVVSLLNSTFLNNSASMGGGAIFVNDTELLMDGKMTSLINNTGSGAPIELFSSRFNLKYAIFDGNSISKFGEGIVSFDSKISFGNLTFVKQKTVRRRRNLGVTDNYSRDILMATDPTDLKLNASCISWEKTLVKSSGIYPVTTCPPVPTPITAATPMASSPMMASPTAVSPIAASPMATSPIAASPTAASPIAKSPTTQSPTATSPTATSPTAPINAPTLLSTSPPSMAPTPPTEPSCFSGWNTVEVKDMGHIQIAHLKIGDHVRTSDGQFTQVYGFGHMDPAKEAVFLQIFFDGYIGKREHYMNASSFVLEISPRHLLMMDISNQKYPIRASEVIVGDKLSGLTVNKISPIRLRGVYAPLTFSGDLVVSGVHVSNYVNVLEYNAWIQNQHALGHALFFPQRMFCNNLIEICKKEKCINGYGYTAYVVVRGSLIINQLGTFDFGMIMSYLEIVMLVVIGCFAWYLGARIAVSVLKRKYFK